MQEQINEKLSLLFDDELSSTQAVSLLKSVRQEPELQAKLERYALISQALKGEQSAVAGKDFLERVHQQLEQEPVYFLPRKKDSSHLKKTAVAVAASIVLAVVWLSSSQLHKSINNSYIGAGMVAQRAVDDEQMNVRFREYLQAHDNVWYVNSNAGVQSYAHVASYQQE